MIKKRLLTVLLMGGIIATGAYAQAPQKKVTATI